MLLTRVVVRARPRGAIVNAAIELLANGVLYVILIFLRVVQAGSRLSLHLMRVYMGLDTRRVLWTGVCKNCMIVLARPRLFDPAARETVIARHGPVWRLLAVLCGRLVYVRAWHVAEALIVDEFGD